MTHLCLYFKISCLIFNCCLCEPMLNCPASLVWDDYWSTSLYPCIPASVGGKDAGFHHEWTSIGDHCLCQSTNSSLHCVLHWQALIMFSPGKSLGLFFLLMQVMLVLCIDTLAAWPVTDPTLGQLYQSLMFHYSGSPPAKHTYGIWMQSFTMDKIWTVRPLLCSLIKKFM